MYLDKWIALLESVEQVAETAFTQAVEKSEDSLVELQKERMDIGLDVNGKPITYNKQRKSPLNSTGAYTNKYAKKREKAGKQTRHVDLKFTGEYQNKLKADTRKNGNAIDVDIKSDATHSVYVEKNYNDIYGLDKFQQQEIEKDIAQEIEQKIKNHLNK